MYAWASLKLRAACDREQDRGEERGEQHEEQQHFDDDVERHAAAEQTGGQSGAVGGDRHGDQVDERREDGDRQHGDIFGEQQPEPRHGRGDESFQRAAFAFAGREVDRRIDGAGDGHQHQDERDESRQRKWRCAGETNWPSDGVGRHASRGRRVLPAVDSTRRRCTPRSRDSTKCSAASLVASRRDRRAPIWPAFANRCSSHCPALASINGRQMQRRIGHMSPQRLVGISDQA